METVVPFVNIYINMIKLISVNRIYVKHNTTRLVVQFCRWYFIWKCASFPSLILFVFEIRRSHFRLCFSSFFFVIRTFFSIFSVRCFGWFSFVSTFNDVSQEDASQRYEIEIYELLPPIIGTGVKYNIGFEHFSLKNNSCGSSIIIIRAECRVQKRALAKKRSR